MSSLATQSYPDFDALVSRHLSPRRSADPFAELRDQRALFVLKPQSTCTTPKDIDLSDPIFWEFLEQFIDELYETEAFKRTEEIYVNPQFAVTARKNLDNPLSELVGRMTRGAHIKDIVRLGVQRMHERVMNGEEVSGEEIFLSIFSCFAHDLMVTAFSHLSQDALLDKGIDVDHDLLLAYGLSQNWVGQFLSRWGLDWKRAVVAALPPSFLTTDSDSRFEDWKKLENQLVTLINEYPEVWQKYQIRYGYGSIETIINLDPKDPEYDGDLLSDPELIRIAQLAHDALDPGYGRTDHTQKESLEMKAVSLLINGKLYEHQLIGHRTPTDFTNLTEELRNSLYGRGRKPSGKLFTCFVQSSEGDFNFALIEHKRNEYIIRAIYPESVPNHQFNLFEEDFEKMRNNLQRVKVPKANSRFFEYIRSFIPKGDGTWICKTIDSLLKTYLSLGDYQSERVASLTATLGRAFYEKACTSANGGNGVNPLDLIFGDHKTCTEQWNEDHQQILLDGYDTHYIPIYYIKPKSTKNGEAIIGPNAPSKKSLNLLFDRLNNLAKEFEGRIKNSRFVPEVICAESAPVKKRFTCNLTPEAHAELNKRMSQKSIKDSNGALWHIRKARHDTDTFSVGFRAESYNPTVEFHYALHRGWILAIRKEHLPAMSENKRAWLVKEIKRIVKETPDINFDDFYEDLHFPPMNAAKSNN